MSTKAQGIVKSAAVFTGKARVQTFTIVFANEEDRPIPSVRCRIAQGGKTAEHKGDDKGVMEFPIKGDDKLRIELLDDKKTAQKSSTPGNDANKKELPVIELCNKQGEPNPVKGHGALGNEVSTPSKMQYDNLSNDKNTIVTRLQTLLDDLLYPLGPDGKDGKFGNYTEKAVSEFQKKARDFAGKPLREGGRVGPVTADALNRAMVGTWFPAYVTPIELTKDSLASLFITSTEAELKNGVTIDPKDTKKAKVAVIKVQGDITKIEWEKTEAVASDGLKKDNRKIKLLVETKSIEDNSDAIVGVYQFKKDADPTLVKRIEDLKIRRNQLCGNDGKPCELEFQWHQTIYDYKRTQYFLKVRIGRILKSAEQTKEKMTRLIHLDGIVANPDDTLPGADKEGKWLRKYLVDNGPWIEATVDELKKDGHEVVMFRAKASNVNIKKFSWLVRGNKFLHHQASHGDALCYNHTPKIQVQKTGTTGADGVDNYECPTCHNLNKVVGAICLKDDNFEKANVKDLARSPKVLVLANCCLTAINDVFPKAWLDKKTQWYIGWAVPVDDNAAIGFAKSFYKRWMEHYKMNPDKVLNAFNDVQGAYASYRPRIFKK